MLVLSRKDGETVLIDGVIRVKVLGIQGSRVKLGFSAPPDVTVQREEIASGPASQPIPPLCVAAASRRPLQAAG